MLVETNSHCQRLGAMQCTRQHSRVGGATTKATVGSADWGEIVLGLQAVTDLGH